MNEVYAYRVAYGKDDIPMKDREYKLSAQSPVGSVKEILKYLEDSHYNTLICLDKYMNKEEQRHDIKKD